MPKICYEQKNFKPETLAVIEKANEIIEAYSEAGYDLTLRQLYYQFVARDLLPNNDKSYDRLGGIVSDARRAGLIDWDAIVDRTRHVRHPAAWGSPGEMVSACAEQYDVNWWKNQSVHVEVWVEKDALVGVIETACEPWHCPYFSCRGYTSDSEIWSSAIRLKKQASLHGKRIVVLHLGDHDPSGIDMSRDIEDRLRMFSGLGKKQLEVRRIALTMDQVDEVGPPPNPAKLTDSRAPKYVDEYGDDSWELDALEPQYISNLIGETIEPLLDAEAWADSESERDAGREKLTDVAAQIDDE